MPRSLCHSRRAARKVVRLAVTFLVSACAFFGSVVAYADPIILWELQGTVYITENGRPSNGITSVKLSCQYQVSEGGFVDPETGEVSVEGRTFNRVSSTSFPCQRGECPFDEELQTGGGPVSCRWTVRPGRSTTNYPWQPTGGGPEEVQIDIAGVPALGAFLAALLLAWVVELPVVFLMLRYVFRPPYQDTKRLLGVACLATLVTLPLAWYVLPFIRSVLTLDGWVYIALVEAFVIAIEACIFVALLRITVRKAALVSLLANGLSFLVGLAMPWGAIA